MNVYVSWGKNVSFLENFANLLNKWSSGRSAILVGVIILLSDVLIFQNKLLTRMRIKEESSKFLQIKHYLQSNIIVVNKKSSNQEYVSQKTQQRLSSMMTHRFLFSSSKHCTFYFRVMWFLKKSWLAHKIGSTLFLYRSIIFISMYRLEKTCYAY